MQICLSEAITNFIIMTIDGGYRVSAYENLNPIQGLLLFLVGSFSSSAKYQYNSNLCQ